MPDEEAPLPMIMPGAVPMSGAAAALGWLVFAASCGHDASQHTETVPSRPTPTCAAPVDECWRAWQVSRRPYMMDFRLFEKATALARECADGGDPFGEYIAVTATYELCGSDVHEYRSSLAALRVSSCDACRIMAVRDLGLSLLSTEPVDVARAHDLLRQSCQDFIRTRPVRFLPDEKYPCDVLDFSSPENVTLHQEFVELMGKCARDLEPHRNALREHAESRRFATSLDGGEP